MEFSCLLAEKTPSSGFEDVGGENSIRRPQIIEYRLLLTDFRLQITEYR
jgi:hypothetical protein